MYVAAQKDSTTTRHYVAGYYVGGHCVAEFSDGFLQGSVDVLDTSEEKGHHHFCTIKTFRSYFGSRRVASDHIHSSRAMVWSRDFVHADLVLSPDATTVHRTTECGWHGFVGASTFRTGVHTFTMNMSGHWAVGVVDTHMNFRVRNCLWCATNLAWNGTYGVTKNAAIDVTTNGVTIEGWHDSP